MNKPFVTVYQPMRGWAAVCMVWDVKTDMYVPEQTGVDSFATVEEAEVDAKAWAAAELIAYKPYRGEVTCPICDGKCLSCSVLSDEPDQFDCQGCNLACCGFCIVRRAKEAGEW